jgi:hypothetical protein
MGNENCRSARDVEFGVREDLDITGRVGQGKHPVTSFHLPGRGPI